jgi:hypothetical protein
MKKIDENFENFIKEGMHNIPMPQSDFKVPGYKIIWLKAKLDKWEKANVKFIRLENIAKFLIIVFTLFGISFTIFEKWSEILKITYDPAIASKVISSFNSMPFSFAIFIVGFLLGGIYFWYRDSTSID